MKKAILVNVVCLLDSKMSANQTASVNVNKKQVQRIQANKS